MVVQVLPWGLALAGGANLHITLPRVLGVVLVIAAFIAAGGLVALLFSNDTTSVKEAITYGLGWQGLIGGFIQGRRAEG